jgi:hypothetical protein
MGSTESIQLLKDLATWAGILGGASLATVYFSFLAIILGVKALWRS